MPFNTFHLNKITYIQLTNLFLLLLLLFLLLLLLLLLLIHYLTN